jgi:NADH dehydrogenase
MNIERIVVLGGTGFIGRHLAAALVDRGRELVVPTRADERGKPISMLPRVEIVEADVRDATALTMLSRGADAIVNLVGTLHGSRRATFEDIHVGITDAAIRACRSNNIARYVHMSALGARPEAPSEYQRTKAAAEAKVQASGLAWTIFRPSVVFGPDDQFLNRFATMARFLPVIFLPRAEAKFQPVWVCDVAHAFATALDTDATIGRRYDLVGPRVYTLRELVRYVASLIGKRRIVIGVPDAIGALQAAVLEHLPGKMLTRDNLASMRVDNVGDATDRELFGGPPRSLESVAPKYLSPAATHDRFGVYRQRRPR